MVEFDLAGALRRVQKTSFGGVVKGTDLNRRDRTELTRRGFLWKIVYGWYALTTPQARAGDTTVMNMFYWPFIARYCREYFDENYCVSPENSLEIHTGRTSPPDILKILVIRPLNRIFQLPDGHSVSFYHSPNGLPEKAVSYEGVNTMPLAESLVRSAPEAFLERTDLVQVAMITANETDVTRAVLRWRSGAAAARIISAWKKLHREEAAERLKAEVTRASIQTPLVAADPDWNTRLEVLPSAVCTYFAAMWDRMAAVIHQDFRVTPTWRVRPERKDAFLASVEALRQDDAYNSLSIEGYQVTPELIDRIDREGWDPAHNESDRQSRDAMAAKGYFDAFNAVKESLGKIFGGKDATDIIKRDYETWYRALFGPLVQAQILRAHDLIGFRRHPVYIRGSRHVPPAYEVLPDLMNTYFMKLSAEKSALVRGILAHFGLGFIHPYPDGNGRMARFMMNAHLGSGGHSWTIIHTENRAAYLAALELASSKEDIKPFASFIVKEMQAAQAVKGRKTSAEAASKRRGKR